MKLRVLALDHYFDQDLKALEAHPALEVRRISFERLRQPALDMLGQHVGTGLEAFADPKLEWSRRRYAAWLSLEVRRLYLEWSFDLVVLPSDIFFYVRALPAAAHALGIPVVVVQKETTISPDTMEAHSLAVGEYAPFVSDFMTVCSERQRQFWIRTGANPELVVVTGQPRFDLYAGEAPKAPSEIPKVLFLSYELDAYEPGVGGGKGLLTWKSLRSASERVLVGLAQAGKCEVQVKPHPQQSRQGEEERLRQLAGTAWGTSVRLADAESDTRQMILEADVVVGFQTTGLYEAAAAGRAAIYAAWGLEYEARKERLIRYDLAPEACLGYADSEEALERLLLSDLPGTGVSCRDWFEEALGPIDGGATERVARLLVDVAARWPAGDVRRALDASRSRFAARMLIRSIASELFWATVQVPASMAGRGRGVRSRRASAAGRRRLAAHALGRRG